MASLAMVSTTVAVVEIGPVSSPVTRLAWFIDGYLHGSRKRAANQGRTNRENYRRLIACDQRPRLARGTVGDCLDALVADERPLLDTPISTGVGSTIRYGRKHQACPGIEGVSAAELNNPVVCNARRRASAGGRSPSLGRWTSLVC